MENVINEPTTASDWSRMASTTSPYIFKIGNVADIDFIINFLHQNKFTMFLRKVDEKFPDDVILEFMNNDKEKMFSVLSKKRSKEATSSPRYDSYSSNRIKNLESISKTGYTTSYIDKNVASIIDGKDYWFVNRFFGKKSANKPISPS